MKRLIGLRRLGMVVAILVAATLLSPADGYAVARGKPDLKVVVGRYTLQHGQFWAPRGQTRGTFNWRHKTKNVGEAASRSSTTGIQFATGTPADTLAVRRLEPNATLEESGTFELDFSAMAYGPYPVQICADVANRISESNEHNNCKSAHEFYIVPYVLSGRVSGIVTWHPPDGSTQTLSWEGTLSFDISDGAPSGDDGVFEYRYQSGTLTFTYNYASQSCTGSGTAQYTPTSEDGVLLTFGRPTFYNSFGGSIGSGFNISYMLTCPPAPPTPVQFPVSSSTGFPWFDTGGVRRAPGGVDTLSNTYTALSPVFPVQYSWTLAASG